METLGTDWAVDGTSVSFISSTFDVIPDVADLLFMAGPAILTFYVTRRLVSAYQSQAIQNNNIADRTLLCCVLFSIGATEIVKFNVFTETALNSAFDVGKNPTVSFTSLTS